MSLMRPIMLDVLGFRKVENLELEQSMRAAEIRMNEFIWMNSITREDRIKNIDSGQDERKYTEMIRL